jgi:RNA ligase
MFQFPEIVSIDDVLPHVADRPEILIINKGDYTVINYAVVTPDLFQPVTDIKSAMLRECRGLIFDAKGRLISRPFHKFFNVGEREETLPHNIDFTNHAVYDKLDGSMIRPLWFGAFDVRLATKMGITDTSIQTEEWMNSDFDRRQTYRDFFDFCYGFDHTPIFEWVSPENRIVVSYNEPNLILLAMRDLRTGEYLPHDEIKEIVDDYEIPLVKRYDSFESISDFIVKTKGEVGNEGYIVELNNGNRVKIKTDEYTRIHRVKERVQQPRHVIALILDEQLDDAKSGLIGPDLVKVEALEREYFERFQRRLDEIEVTWDDVKSKYETAKDFAINSSMDDVMKKFMFAKYSGRDTRVMLTDEVRKNLGQDKKYQDFLDTYFAK